jgi:putative ABC transport system permease protein
VDASVEDTARADSSPPEEGGEESHRYRLRFLPMLFRLYWLRLRTQPVQEALAVAGIAVGVALIFAVEIANTSVPASVRDLVRGIAGPASLEVAARAPEGFDERLMSKVGEAPGVFGDSGVLDARVTVVGPHGHRALTLFGADAAISSIGGPLAHRFPTRVLESAAPAGVQALGLIRQLHGAHVDTIALPEGAAHALGASVGQLLLIDAGGRQVVVLCGAVLSARQFGAAAESPVAIAQLPAAQRIAGLPHRLTRILILPERGQEATARRALMRLFGRTLNVRSSDSEVNLLEAATRS